MKKFVYVTITMPKDFRELMDRYAKKNFQRRSEFIRSAVLKYIEFLDQKEEEKSS